MNRDTFFAFARREPFSGSMTQAQVDGLNAILDAWAQDPRCTDQRWLAYMLATAFHETGARMQPVREGYALTDAQARKILANRSYAKPDPVTGCAYYGRGLVQLTWAENYKRMGDRLGVPLYQNPDLALEAATSSRIMFEGMIDGLFTGKALEDYFNGGADDPVEARRIINKTDRANQIAGYHLAFMAAITAAGDDSAAEPEPVERETPAPWYPEDRKPLPQTGTIRAGTIAGAATTVATVGQAARSVDPKGEYTKSIFGNEWFPLVLLIIALSAIGYLVWRRIDDRKKGKR